MKIRLSDSKSLIFWVTIIKIKFPFIRMFGASLSIAGCWQNVFKVILQPLTFVSIFKSRSNVLIRLSEKQNYIDTKNFIHIKILSLQKLLRSWQSFIKCNHIDQSKFRGAYVFFRIESKTNVVVAILEYFSSLDSPFLMELGNEQLL